MKELVKKYAEKYGLDPAIVFGVCMQESSMNPKARRFEPNWCYFYMLPTLPGVTTADEHNDQATSWGLMQVMGAVLREHGYKGVLPDILNDPEAQIDYGCKHLHKKIMKYGLELGILAYNAGSPRKKNGKWVNAAYLKKVLKYSEGWTDG